MIKGAICRDNIHLIGYLIEKGFDINCIFDVFFVSLIFFSFEYEKTVLHIAAESSTSQMIKILLDIGIDINSTNNDNF